MGAGGSSKIRCVCGSHGRNVIPHVSFVLGIMARRWFCRSRRGGWMDGKEGVVG